MLGQFRFKAAVSDNAQEGIECTEHTVAERAYGQASTMRHLLTYDPACREILRKRLLFELVVRWLVS